MKKWIAIHLAVLIVLIAAVVYLGFCVGYKTIYYRMYKEDRITGQITVDIDGQAVVFDEERTRGHWNCKGDFSLGDHEANVSLKAGDYGPYAFDMYIVGMDQPLQFSTYQYNWWNVKTFRIDIAVDNAEKTAHVRCFTTNINEKGNIYKNESTSELELADELTIGFN